LSKGEKGEPSAKIKERVNRARQIQRKRYEGLKIYSNSQLSAGMLTEFCGIDERSNGILKMAFEKMGLSARAHSRILKVARTIADLAGEPNIKAEHIAEAIQYRSLDRKYFG
ncbi:MAG: magnesium chelatase, partial [Clostridia bacterium]|nr:magnesium chelatase [Clostridia bacterium]